MEAHFMKSGFLVASCAVFLLAVSSSFGQTRDYRAERLVLDDNNGNTLVIQTPAGPITGGTLTVPDPGGAGQFLISNPSGGTQSVAGDLLPGTDDTYDLGSGAARWQDIFASGDVSVGGEVRFVETGGGTDYVGFQAPAAIAANQIWTLPAADGANGEVLTTDGAGTLSWAAGGGGGTVSTNASLTGDGSGGSPLGINLANGNTWTGTQTFSPVSSVGVIIDNTHLALINSDNTARQIRFQEGSTSGTNFASFEAAPTMAGNTNYVLPNADGAPGDALLTNGAGGLSWGSAAAAPQFSRTDVNVTAGGNNDITTGGSSLIRITGFTGGSGAFTLRSLTGGVDGKMIVVYNLTGQNMTTAFNSGVPAANGIVNTGGGTANTIGNGQLLLVYDGGQSRWNIIYFKN